MEIKTQIIVAVFTAVAGILLGVMMIVVAVCYRRRRDIDRTRGHGVHYRRHDHHGTEDTVSIDFEHRNGRNHSNFSLASMEGISEEYEEEDRIEIDQRPKVHHAKWNRGSSKTDRHTASLRRDSCDVNGMNSDFGDSRTNSIEMQHIPRPHLWSEEYGGQETSELTYSMGHHSSGNVEMPHIPRPIVRPHRSELYEDSRTRNSLYDNDRDLQSGNTSSHRNSSVEFY